MKTLIDRPDTQRIRNFDRMVAKLSPHLTDNEIDRIVDFMHTIAGSQWDINPSVEDSAAQLRLILGRERYAEAKYAWSQRNQHLLKTTGQRKFLHKLTGRLYDGLDATDNPDDYQEMYV